MTKDGKIIQKNIYKWDELSADFDAAYQKFIGSNPYINPQRYLHRLIRRGCVLEMRRK